MTGPRPGPQPATEPLPEPGTRLWAEDFLGPSFQFRPLPLASDDEGVVAATLVRCTARPPGPATDDNHRARVQVVLYVHGWADYFLQAELAERLSHLTGPDGAHTVHLLAHSFGGLVAAMWADRHPGALGTLILNAPWLELQGSSLLRNLAMHLVEPVARADPRRPFHFPEMPGYWQSVSSDAHGQWQLHPVWRPAASFPIRAGWAKAVLAGHAAVARGLDITAPVLVMLSDQTRIQAEWTEDLMHADAVIDVDETATRALRLGRRVAVFRYPGAIHDVFLSQRRIREEAYQDVASWVQSYPCGAAASTAPP